MTYDDRLELPRDDEGRPVGYSVGRAAAISDWLVRHEARSDDERVKAALRAAGARTRKPKTKVDWSTQPLGEVADAEIARRLGVAPSVVCNARKRLGIAPVVERRAWTRREDASLRAHFAAHGFGSLGVLAKRLERTKAAVHQRMCNLGLSRTRPRGLWPKSLAALARLWGYHRKRIQTAADRLGLTLKRGARNALLVTREQAKAIREELARHPDGLKLYRRQAGEWALGESCLGCGRTMVKRWALERCCHCWERLSPQERELEKERLAEVAAAQRALDAVRQSTATTPGERRARYNAIARERRRVLRAKDPSFRAREAKYAQRYRERKLAEEASC